MNSFAATHTKWLVDGSEFINLKQLRKFYNKLDWKQKTEFNNTMNLEDALNIVPGALSAFEDLVALKKKALKELKESVLKPKLDKK